MFLAVVMFSCSMHLETFAENSGNGTVAPNDSKVEKEVPQEDAESGTESSDGETKEKDKQKADETETNGEVKVVDKIREIDQMELPTPEKKSKKSKVQPEEEKPYIIAEDENQRDAFTKYFRMSDGSMMAAQYPEPIHFQDESGEYQDYNNQLDLSTPIIDIKKEKQATEDSKSDEALTNPAESEMNQKSDGSEGAGKEPGKDESSESSGEQLSAADQSASGEIPAENETTEEQVSSEPDESSMDRTTPSSSNPSAVVVCWDVTK